MQSLTDQTYSQLFLEARDLPSGLQLSQDSRMRGADPNDNAFSRCSGLRSGLVAWQAPINSPIERVVDIRWVFPTEELALAYHQQTLQINCENMPYSQNAPSIGSECYVFGGKLDMGFATVTSYLYLFRIRTVIVKLYVAQGGGQTININNVAVLAQNAFNRVNSILSSLPQLPNQIYPNSNSYQPPMPYQQTAQTQQHNPYPYAQPPQGQVNYSFPPQEQTLYQPGMQSPAIPYSPQPIPPTNTQQPSSGLAISYAVLGTITWFLSIPVYILFMALTIDGHLSSGDEEGLVVMSILTSLFAIPSGILFLTWLYKTWDAVPKPYQNTSPGKALGLLFVPFFNIYWMFRAIPGLSKSIENAHKAINPNKAGGGSFVLGIITCVMVLFPFINIFAFIPFLVWVLMTNNAKNKMLRDYQAQGGYRQP